jgi:2'-5' RNA ligase
VGIAVEIYFDETGEKHIRHLMAILTERGIPPVLDQLGFRPHVSLAVFPAVEVEAVTSVVQDFTQSTGTFSLAFSHLGAFSTAEGVVFLAPTFTERLRHLHQAFHARLSRAGLVSSPYYEPDRWVPHCTVTTDIDPTQMSLAVQTLVEEFEPFEVQCLSLGVITFRPVTLHARFQLAGV